MTNPAQEAVDRIRARRIAAGTLGKVTREIAHDLRVTTEADTEDDS